MTGHPTNTQYVRRLLCARGLRAFGDGFISLLLPVYLLSLGLTPFQVGVIATGTLLGSGVMTLAVGLHAHRFRYRTLLLAAAALMTLTGIGFAAVTSFWPLLLIAIVGTLNPSSGDVSVFMPLEHALLSRTVADRERTATFARYSLVGALVGALGALCAGAPEIMAAKLHWDLAAMYPLMFTLYAAIGVASALIYRGLPRAASADVEAPPAPLRQSKKIVYTLAALFSLDAFAGGFIVQSLLALWLLQRFQLSIAETGVIFFWTGVFSAFSYIVAAKIANRIGLINTMVFTHLPSSVLLIMVPFAPSLGVAIALLLVRSALSQMDVPTRSSYVMAVVTPGERAAAASITAVPRSLAASISPLIAGYLLGVSGFGWPLVVAGGMKIGYDLLLLLMFRTVRPPEESRSSAVRGSGG
jgi:MFS family permease